MAAHKFSALYLEPFRKYRRSKFALKLPAQIHRYPQSQKLEGMCITKVTFNLILPLGLLSLSWINIHISKMNIRFAIKTQSNFKFNQTPFCKQFVVHATDTEIISACGHPNAKLLLLLFK